MSLAIPDAPAVPRFARLSVIAIATIFGLTYSLSAAAIALDLEARGWSSAAIGANAAMHAIGVLIAAPVLPLLVVRFGGRTMVLGALAASAVILCLLAVVPLVWLWFPLRICLGAAAEVLFVISETWTNDLSTESSRGRAMASYAAATSLGFAGGPLILSVLGGAGPLAYGIGALIALAAMVPACLFSPPAARGLPMRHGFREYLRLAPLALFATALNAAIEAAGLTFLPLYAMSAGWSADRAETLTTVLLVGAIVLQLPIGWLNDRVNRNHLVLWLAVAAAIGALAWPLVLDRPVLTYALLFVWGGVFVGIYTTMMTIVGQKFTGDRLVGVFAAMGVSWGVGALAGPTVVGSLGSVTSHPLPFAAAFACLIFAGFAWRVRRG